jgi:hypothetical protein
MYLNARDPLPINFNPFIMFKDTAIKSVPLPLLCFFPSHPPLLPPSRSKDWVACASSYAVATTQFYTLVRSLPLRLQLLFCIKSCRCRSATARSLPTSSLNFLWT